MASTIYSHKQNAGYPHQQQLMKVKSDLDEIFRNQGDL